MAEQHAGVDRAERERGQHQLRGEERRAVGPAGGGEHDERRDADEPGRRWRARLRGQRAIDATR